MITEVVSKVTFVSNKKEIINVIFDVSSHK